MTNDVPWYVSLIVSFLPLVLACGVIAWHGRQVRRSMTTRDGRSLAQVFDDVAREMKRANDLRDGSKP
jgi:Flp pilus assembly protein TadB